jgi:hypothetical protein
MSRLPILLAAAGAALLVALLLVGCGGHKTPPSAEQVARSWSAALNIAHDQTAANLFANGAKIIQVTELTLATHAEAVHWNEGLPCGGKIVSVTHESATDVLVVFVLQTRPLHICGGPGDKAAAIFRVRDGKIVLWHEVAVPPPHAGGGGTII